MPLIDFFAKIYAEGGMVQMKLIRKRRNGYALMLAVSICLAVWLGATFMIEAVFAFGAVSLISLLLLVRESREGKKIRQRPPKQIPQANKNYRDTDVEIDKSSKETKNYVEDKIKKQAANLGKKALTNLLNQTLSASDTAGEMRIPMNDAQKSCLTDVISELTKMLGR
jgi:hypothetical protein